MRCLHQWELGNTLSICGVLCLRNPRRWLCHQKKSNPWNSNEHWCRCPCYNLRHPGSKSSNHPSMFGEKMDPHVLGIVAAARVSSEIVLCAARRPLREVLFSTALHWWRTRWKIAIVSISIRSLQASENAAGESSGIAPGTTAESVSVYSEADATDDIYKVPQSNVPVDPSKVPEGVLFQVCSSSVVPSYKPLQYCIVLGLGVWRVVYKPLALIERAWNWQCWLGALFQVQGTHPYAGEDTDELTFDAGEIINVLPFEDPEDQVLDGWTTGVIRASMFVWSRKFPQSLWQVLQATLVEMLIVLSSGRRLVVRREDIDWWERCLPRKLHQANLATSEGFYDINHPSNQPSFLQHRIIHLITLLSPQQDVNMLSRVFQQSGTKHFVLAENDACDGFTFVRNSSLFLSVETSFVYIRL